MIVVVGESGSGKSSIADYIVKNYEGYHKVVTVTTRPPRTGERDGVDYYFVTDDEFIKLKGQNYFLETAEYRGWKYGCPMKNLGKKTIAVLTPAGLRAAKRKSVNTVSFYINVDRASRMIKLIQRGDDIDEVIRRSTSDVGQFDGVENEVDLAVCNFKYEKPVSDMADIIMKYMETANESN